MFNYNAVTLDDLTNGLDRCKKAEDSDSGCSVSGANVGLYHGSRILFERTSSPVGGV